eukprot:scaffold1049_cov168-Amphora_coffeaeformis.AAC.18
MLLDCESLDCDDSRALRDIQIVKVKTKIVNDKKFSDGAVIAYFLLCTHSRMLSGCCAHRRYFQARRIESCRGEKGGGYWVRNLRRVEYRTNAFLKETCKCRTGNTIPAPDFLFFALSDLRACFDFNFHLLTGFMQWVWRNALLYYSLLNRTVQSNVEAVM